MFSLTECLAAAGSLKKDQRVIEANVANRWLPTMKKQRWQDASNTFM